MAYGHELADLAEVHDLITQLEGDWSYAGAVMRGLFAGRWRKHGGRPYLSVGKLAQAYDQARAERDRVMRFPPDRGDVAAVLVE
ncbi:MAG: hypothetical protein KDI69_10690 [Xanthomonadales bacterium]|nr:hypothetical protein [Xanthomonadales bacterium]